jgi:LmbE family N-acetylglucosaminyl deacetylase
MMPLTLTSRSKSGHELLCVGAHSDDIEIGCGGTIMRLLRELRVGAVTWVVLSGDGPRAREARLGARRVTGGRPAVRVIQQTFRDSYFPYSGAAIKEFFAQLKREVNPDVVFTHYRDDLHQDHRLVSELTYNAFRDHLIMEYEVMKLDGDLGNPNVYVPLSLATVGRKARILKDCFRTQRDKRWFSDDAFRALMRLRGVEAGAASGLAEAFYCRKLVL